jgi:hypothetical protein
VADVILKGRRWQATVHAQDVRVALKSQWPLSVPTSLQSFPWRLFGDTAPDADSGLPRKSMEAQGPGYRPGRRLRVPGGRPLGSVAGSPEARKPAGDLSGTSLGVEFSQ